MFMKTLLATSALVVASSMAVAATHPATKPTLSVLKQMDREHAISKGIVVNQKGFQLGAHVLGHVNGTGKNAKQSGYSTPKGGGYSNLSTETNALFVSWFGWFAGGTNIHSAYSGSFCYSYSGNGACINHYKYKVSETENISQSAAQPFTGAKKASQVQLGAEQYSGSGGAEVDLDANTAACGPGTASCPGSKLAHGSFPTPVAFTGQCCSGLQTVALNKKVKLSPTSQYWVVLKANGSPSGRVAWNGQASNWTSLGGEQYNYTLYEKIAETYGTTAHTNYCGGVCHYNTTINENSGGWIHTSAFSYDEQSGGFSVD